LFEFQLTTNISFRRVSILIISMIERFGERSRSRRIYIYDYSSR